MTGDRFSRRTLTEPQEIVAFLEGVLRFSTQDRIIGLTPDGTIQLWNEGARSLYGYAAEEIIGRANTVLHTPEDATSGKLGHIIDSALPDGKWEGRLTTVRTLPACSLISVIVPATSMVMSGSRLNCIASDCRARWSAESRRPVWVR